MKTQTCLQIDQSWVPSWMKDPKQVRREIVSKFDDEEKHFLLQILSRMI